MTKEKLQEILDKVWMRDWSADDAHDAIWGESFAGYTQEITTPFGLKIERDLHFKDDGVKDYGSLETLAGI